MGRKLKRKMNDGSNSEDEEKKSDGDSEKKNDSGDWVRVKMRGNRVMTVRRNQRTLMKQKIRFTKKIIYNDAY